MTRRPQAIGRAGEDRAARWYRRRGYRVLARNWRCRDGEIDLVVARGGTVVVCEVKTRSSLAFGAPAEAVTPAKQARIRKVAAAWLRASGARPHQVRFDVVAIVGTDLEVIEAAF